MGAPRPRLIGSGNCSNASLAVGSGLDECRAAHLQHGTPTLTSSSPALMALPALLSITCKSPFARVMVAWEQSGQGDCQLTLQQAQLLAIDAGFVFKGSHEPGTPLARRADLQGESASPVAPALCRSFHYPCPLPSLPLPPPHTREPRSHV